MAAGLLTTATDSRSPNDAMRSLTWAAWPGYRQHSPCASASRIRTRDRPAITAAASSSESIPATHAAAISPWLWPATASGTTPAACHTAASATDTAHSAGCSTSSRLSYGAPSAPASTSSTRHPVSGSSAAEHCASREARHHRAGRSRPAPYPSPPNAPVQSGKHQDHSSGAAGRHRPGHRPRPRLARRHRRQPCRQFLPARADHHRPVLELRPGGGQRPAHVGGIGVRVSGQVHGQPPGLRAARTGRSFVPDSSHAQCASSPAAPACPPGSKAIRADAVSALGPPR